MKKIDINPQTRIMSVDPGVTTGFVLYIGDLHNKMAGQHKGSLDGFLQIVNDFYPDIIVYEQFDYTHRDKANLTAVEFIAMIKWYAERRDVTLVPQNKAYGKAYFDNEKLKRLKLYVPGIPHGMDALRHLLQFLMGNNAFDLKLLKR